jgi:hypothetical protein
MVHPRQHIGDHPIGGRRVVGDAVSRRLGNLDTNEFVT